MNKNQKQNTLVVLGAVGIVVVSALATVAFTTGLMGSMGRDDEGYKNITFTDATIACEEEVVDTFGKKLSQKVVDNHSSRFESQVGLYKIFLSAYTKNKNQTVEYFVSCFVQARNGRISKFETFENKEAPKGEAIKKHSDKFIEWPQ